MNDIINAVWPEWQTDGEPLGKGSYGTVYRAVRRDKIESCTAVKVITIPRDKSELDSLRSEGMTIEQSEAYFKNVVDIFVREIQIMQSFKGHSNIVSVEDHKVVKNVDTIGWTIFIRMELLTPFNDYFEGRLPAGEELIKIGCDICAALELCAKKNIIHRDIKPENIFVNENGDFKLGDFGIARTLESASMSLSQKGTPNYMAPEVANGTKYDATVDTYSLGVVLYRYANDGRLPFVAADQVINPIERRKALDRRLAGEQLPAPCSAAPEFAKLILRACEYDPQKRFRSPTEMKAALAAVDNACVMCEGGAASQDLPKHSRLFAADRSTQSVEYALAGFDREQREAPEKSRKRLIAIFSAAAAAVAVVLAVILLPNALRDKTNGQDIIDTAGSSNASRQEVVSDLPQSPAGTTTPKSTTTTPSVATTPEESSAPSVTTTPGQTTAPEGTTTTPDGAATTPDWATTTPDWVMTTPSGTTTTPSGTTTTPNGTTTTRPKVTTTTPKATSAPKTTTTTPKVTTTPKATTSTPANDDEPSYDPSKLVTIHGVTYNTATTELILREEDIVDDDLKDIAKLTKLTLLILEGNQISDITPLENLTKLTYLNLTGNQISDITPLEKLTNLTALYLTNNQISNITPLVKLIKLEYLDLAGNQISNITPLAKLTNLTGANLGQNPLSDITPLAKLTELTHLYLFENQISDITPLAKLTNLIELNLLNNQISDITPLANLTQLTYLSLCENLISDITPLVNLTNLTYLNLANNPIKREDKNFLRSQLPAACDIRYGF